jgi:hypothetical protein
MFLDNPGKFVVVSPSPFAPSVPSVPTYQSLERRACGHYIDRGLSCPYRYAGYCNSVPAANLTGSCTMAGATAGAPADTAQHCAYLAGSVTWNNPITTFRSSLTYE